MLIDALHNGESGTKPGGFKPGDLDATRRELDELGVVLTYTRQAEQDTLARALAAASYAAALGLSEVEIAQRLRVSRMTVRKGLGKAGGSVVAPTEKEIR